jgi:hypothetical protein
LTDFQLISREDYFIIESKRWHPVTINLYKNISEWEFLSCLWHGGTYNQGYGLLSFDQLIQDIGFGLVNINKQRKESKNIGRLHDAHIQKALKVTREIKKTVLHELNRLLPNANQKAMQVQRAVYKATKGDSRLAMEHFVYPWDPQLIQDIIQYRAAAVVCHEFIPLFLQAKGYDFLKTNNWDSLNTNQREQLIDYSANNNLPMRFITSNEDVHALQANKWKNFYAPFGENYDELDETLVNLPEGISSILLTYLPNWHLSRPFSNQLELELLLQYAKHHTNIPNGFLLENGKFGHYLHFPNYSTDEKDRRERIGNILEQATAPEIEEAIFLLGNHMNGKFPDYQPVGTKGLVDLILAYPDVSCGKIVDLVNKAILWTDQERSQTSHNSAGGINIQRPNSNQIPAMWIKGIHNPKIETNPLSIFMGYLRKDLRNLIVRGEYYSVFHDWVGEQKLSISNWEGEDDNCPWNDEKSS